jgi:hypothetical protein
MESRLTSRPPHHHHCAGAWQRRTPHATINVLRADQLAAAEAKRSSAELYAINIEKLVGASGIGSDQLFRDLERERQLE